MANKKGFMNRRVFFKYLSLVLLAPVSIVGYFTVKKQKDFQDHSQVILDEVDLKDQEFYQGIFIRIINKEPYFYSNSCSHLGCQIEQIKDQKLICPCHGSSYDLNGKVIKGPAKTDLKSLEFDYLASEKKYIIYKNS